MAVINHADIEALIPAEERREVFEGAIKDSKALSLLTRLPNISTNKERIKVLDSLPLAYWQSGSSAFKKTTSQAWKDKYLVAEELAVIVPIAINDLQDANYDIWGSVKARVQEAIGKAIDEAIFLGVNKPASFPDSILEQAYSHGHQIYQGSNTFYKTVSDAMALVEEDGYEVSGILGGVGLKKAFRELQDTTGQLITGSEVNALPRFFVENGAWDKTKADFIVGDFKQGVYAVRNDLEFKLLEEASIYDPSTHELVYALAQQDMVALRVTFRLGYQLPNPVNATNPDGEARLPFTVVVPTGNAITLTGPEAETFDTSINVKLSAGVKGAKIYYTVNGDTPDATKTLYTSAGISLTSTTTVKAIAIKEGYANSEVYSATFTKGE